MQSPQKFSTIKTSLAIAQETFENRADSILGESPSPSRQVERTDWTLISPLKLNLKPVNVSNADDIVDEENKSEAEESISSHDLSAEEIE